MLEHLEVGPVKVDGLERAVAKLRKEVAAAQKAPAPEASAEAVDAVSREGDTMSGGLTIQKGGLTVESGEITGTLVKVFSVDASQAVRSARVVAEHLEIRGELTADNTQRAIQVRRIEGRQGSPVQVGDLLVPSDRPGHARVAAPAETVGCLVGKAMEPLAEGVGVISVLVV